MYVVPMLLPHGTSQFVLFRFQTLFGYKSWDIRRPSTRDRCATVRRLSAHHNKLLSLFSRAFFICMWSGYFLFTCTLDL